MNFPAHSQAAIFGIFCPICPIEPVILVSELFFRILNQAHVWLANGSLLVEHCLCSSVYLVISFNQFTNFQLSTGTNPPHH